MQPWRLADTASLSDSYVQTTLSLVFPVCYNCLSSQLEGSDTGKATHGTGGHSAAPRRAQSFAGSVDKVHFQAKHLQKPGILMFGELQPM